MMSSLVGVALLALAAVAPSVDNASFLFQIEPAKDRSVQLKAERYHPQPGDFVLYDDHNRWTAKVYRCFGTAGPLHAGIVTRRRDDSLATLEAGPNSAQKVFIFDLEPRLHQFYGTILIRRLRKPLTDEQSCRLTEFSLAQEGKGYALGRLVLQGTPFRPRGNLGSYFFGRTVLDRDRWICSELSIAAATVAGILDAKSFPANTMYPRDLCYDERHDLSPYYEPAALWSPRKELERVGTGVRIVDPKDRPATRP